MLRAWFLVLYFPLIFLRIFFFAFGSVLSFTSIINYLWFIPICVEAQPEAIIFVLFIAHYYIKIFKIVMSRAAPIQAIQTKSKLTHWKWRLVWFAASLLCIWPDLNAKSTKIRLIYHGIWACHFWKRLRASKFYATFACSHPGICVRFVCFFPSSCCRCCCCFFFNDRFLYLTWMCRLMACAISRHSFASIVCQMANDASIN